MVYMVAIIVIIIWFYILMYYGFSELFHSLVLTVFVVIFYAIIAAPGAVAVKSADPQQIEIYRHNVLDFSVQFVPVNMVSILWMADARQLNARFKYILLMLATIVVMSAISSKGISLKPPMH